MLPSVPLCWPERWGLPWNPRSHPVVVCLLLWLDSVSAPDFRALRVILQWSPRRHLCYLRVNTCLLLTIINLIQLNLMMVICWHSLGPLWRCLSMPNAQFRHSDQGLYRCLIQMACSGQWASSCFVALKVFYSSTDKQKTMQLCLIIT